MNITTSELIEKIATLKHRPIQISGYLGSHEGAKDEVIRLYPQLDPSRYYIVGKDCIVAALPTPGDEHGHVTLLLDPTSEIERVSRKHLLATDIHAERPLCQCVDSTSDLDTIMMRKDALRNWVIAHARLLVAAGVTELDCRSLDSGSAGCCQAWNRLLEAVRSGGNAFDAANWVISACFGIG